MRKQANLKQKRTNGKYLLLNFKIEWKNFASYNQENVSSDKIHF